MGFCFQPQRRFMSRLFTWSLWAGFMALKQRPAVQLPGWERRQCFRLGTEKKKLFHVNTTQCESLSLRGIVWDRQADFPFHPVGTVQMFLSFFFFFHVGHLRLRRQLFLPGVGCASDTDTQLIWQVCVSSRCRRVLSECVGDGCGFQRRYQNLLKEPYKCS